ncbi:Hsp20 family protein [Micromonospora sp. STR1s_5]|nr:Hsp20 family protein [Micromonospora sp. STR1s_5]
MLNEGVRSDWPPYDIEKTGENEYGITMAVAGFSRDEIELTQNGTQLLVSGQRKADQAGRQFLHQGIASRAFKQTFNLAEHVLVEGATLENGLLSIKLVREVPERLKPRKIEIGSTASTPIQDNARPQIEVEAERKAA